jgi:transposase
MKKRNTVGRVKGKCPQLTIGLDLGDRSSRYCVLDETGEFVVEREVETRTEALKKVFSAIDRSRIVIEAGTHSAWVARLLEGLGHEVIVANPRRLPLITACSAKSDELDARTLARLARFDPELLGPIQHRGEAAQVHLLTVRSRAALVEARTQLVNAMRGLAKAMGHRLPASKADAVTPKLLGKLPAAMQAPLEALAKQAESVTEQIEKLDRQMAEIAATHYAQETAKLQRVKGVGPVIALTFVLTLESAERFSSSRAVGCYLGLRPKQRQSGKSNPQLRISKEGDVYLRALLVQGAHCILGPHGEDCDLRRWGLKLCQRGGKNARKRAVVAVARKLAVLLHRLWVSQEAYDPFYNAKRQRTAAGACA